MFLLCTELNVFLLEHDTAKSTLNYIQLDAALYLSPVWHSSVHVAFV